MTDAAVDDLATVEQRRPPRRSHPAWPVWSFARWLLVISVAGALWRLGLVVLGSIDEPLKPNDSLYYSIQAGRNAAGDWFRHGLTDQPGAEHPPLTSLYLTPWSLGGGDIVARQRLAMALLGCLVTPLVGLAARSLTAIGGDGRFAARCGLVAATIAAVYPPLWVNDLVVMSETPAIVLVAAALWAAGACAATPSPWRAALVGALVAFATLARSELAGLALGFALVVWVTTRRRGVALLVVGAAIVPVAPWALYNLVRFEHPTLFSTNDGATLLGANCARTYFDEVGHWDLRCLTVELDGAPADDAALDDASGLSVRYRQEALDFIGDHPGRVPVVVAARVGRLLDVYGVGSMVTNDVAEDKPRPAVLAGVVAWWLVAAGAIAGWVELRRRSASMRWWLLVPLTCTLFTAIAFYGGHRIRAPAEPAVVMLAAVAVVAFGERRQAMMPTRQDSGRAVR